MKEVAKENIWLNKKGNNLEILILGTEDKITLHNWYGGSEHQIERIKFQDGSTLNPEQISNLAAAMAASIKPSEAETVWPTDNCFTGILAGTKGLIVDLNKIPLSITNIAGTTLDDRLYGNKANNSFYGGKGNDYIKGEYGDDWIFQNINFENDEIDGGEGFDVVDYSVTQLIPGVAIEGFDCTDKNGVDVDLTSRTAIKLFQHSASPVSDTLKSIEGVIGTNLNDRLKGNFKANLLIGGDGEDDLEGRKGNDDLRGGKGNDRYIFRQGDGEDIITDIEDTADNFDTLVLADFTIDQLSFQQIGYDLKITLKPTINNATPDSITIRSWYQGTAYHIEKFELKNSAITEKEIDSLVKATSNVHIGGKEDDWFDQNIDLEGDTFDGGTGSNTINYSVTPLAHRQAMPSGYRPGVTVNLVDGLAHKNAGQGAPDKLKNIQNVIGTALDDSFTGNDDKNKFSGGYGRDIFIGNKGDDELNGGTGDDTYIFYKGDGHDTIIDFDNAAGNNDKLKLIGIRKDQLSLHKINNDLKISIKHNASNTADDSVTLRDWYLGADYQIEQIELSDGIQQMEQLVTMIGLFSASSSEAANVLPNTLPNTQPAPLLNPVFAPS